MQSIDMIKVKDVIIIGGSYAGLSAAMALGRSHRHVLIVDSGTPCNKQTPNAHNFLTNDGTPPAEIRALSLQQVLAYPTIQLIPTLVVNTKRLENQLFEVTTSENKVYRARKILFATGRKDIMLPIDGFAACWGVSVLHCPYCHGYEVSRQPLGLLANGDNAYELCRLIQNWSKELVLLTNGKANLTLEQRMWIESVGIVIREENIERLIHHNGLLQKVIFTDNSFVNLSAIFARIDSEPQCSIPEDQLGCQLTDQGYLEVNSFMQTNIAGIYGAGDNTTMFRSLAVAVGAGTVAGAMLNKELIEDDLG